jgi:uncharacterized protein (DUF427 family)
MTESVWDYPRPPRLERSEKLVRVVLGGAAGPRSVCEFKGRAGYHDATGGDGTVVRRAGWSYADPSPGFEPITGAVAFYPALVDECTVAGERVQAQEGDCYGGWITSDTVGPFKGGAGTRGW